MNKPSRSTVSSMTKKRVLILLGFLLLIYIVVPRIGSFSESFTAMRNARPALVVLAGMGVIATYFIAATIYWLLAHRPLRYRQTLLVQTASAFTNRLLPAGLGTLTLYVQYLRKKQHTLSQAISVAGANNILGIIGHIVILMVVLVATHDPYPSQLAWHMSTTVWIIISCIVAALILALLLFRSLRQRAYKLTREVFQSLFLYRRRPLRLLMALLASCALTATYVMIFYVCGRGVGIELSLSQIFMVFSIGMVVGTATPTPGGLIGAEAGLTGGLIAYGAPADTALAATLLYRFLTYWLPLIPGFITFVRIRKLYSA